MTELLHMNLFSQHHENQTLKELADKILPIKKIRIIPKHITLIIYIHYHTNLTDV